jgi:hypothetical protein
MQIPILVEPIEGGRYRARAGEPFALSAEGVTADAAQFQLSLLLAERVRDGARLVLLDVPEDPSSAHRVLLFRSDELYKTDWAYRELQEAIAENRRREDEEERRRGESTGI